MGPLQKQLATELAVATFAFDPIQKIRHICEARFDILQKRGRSRCYGDYATGENLSTTASPPFLIPLLLENRKPRQKMLFGRRIPAFRMKSTPFWLSIGELRGPGQVKH
ncbi:MAG: hypothetical protein ABSB29_04225 [Nitrososphaerales archaeon]|jgi:hypothetical protein